MNKFRSVILLTICIGLVYRMACFLMQPEPLQEAVQILPAPVAESVQKSNLPIVRPSAFKAVVPQVETSGVASLDVSLVVAPSVATTSSLTTRSVSGGVAHYAAPVVPDMTNSQQTTAYAYVATPQRSSSPSPVVTPSSAVPVRQAAPQRKVPGTVGSTWEDWLKQYYGDTGKENGDLSGLDKWWNENIGGGNTPNIYDDFYNWAKDKYTPLSDGIWILLSLLLVYGVVLYKRTGNLKKYE